MIRSRVAPLVMCLLVAGGVLVIKRSHHHPAPRRALAPQTNPSANAGIPVNPGYPPRTNEPVEQSPTAAPPGHNASTQTENRKGHLTPEENAELTRMLGEAIASPVSDLIRAVLDAPQRGGARELYLRAMLLIWALAQRPQDLAEVDRVVFAHVRDKDSLQNLIVITGRVGTPESRNLLLRWLNTSALAEFEAEILDAANQGCWATPWQMKYEYWLFLHGDPKNWPILIPPSGNSSTDPEVIRASILRLENSRPLKVQEAASGALSGLATPLSKFEELDPAIQREVSEAYRRWLHESTDPELRSDAIEFLARTGDTSAATEAWLEYERESDVIKRGPLAMSLARYVSSVADVHQVLTAASAEQWVGTRDTFIASLSTDFAKKPADREAVAKLVSSWAIAEPEARLRLKALDRLRSLLPESAPSMQWALTDPSEAVRAKAALALRQK